MSGPASGKTRQITRTDKSGADGILRFAYDENGQLLAQSEHEDMVITRLVEYHRDNCKTNKVISNNKGMKIIVSFENEA